MRARSVLILFVCILGVSGGAGLVAQEENDETKRQQFLRAREKMRALPPATPAASPAKPKPKPRATPRPTTPPPKATATPATPPPATPAPRSTPAPETPKPRPPVTPPPSRATPPQPMRPPPEPAVQVTPAPLPRRQEEPAPVVVEKSGLDDERGLQPAAPVGWFTRWKYLSKPVRQAIDRAPVQKRRWKYIVIHNSGTRQGNAKAFEYYHLRVRKMPNGLAYHFVVGNGTSSGDGEIEIGNRWKRQINGGHVHSDYLNNIALGICLVGDYNRHEPTARQLAALEELIRYLRQRVGKIDRKWASVKAHRHINPPRWPTDCPGDRFPYRWLSGKFE